MDIFAAFSDEVGIPTGPLHVAYKNQTMRLVWELLYDVTDGGMGERSAWPARRRYSAAAGASYPRERRVTVSNKLTISRPKESAANLICRPVLRSFESRRPRLPSVLGIFDPLSCSLHRTSTYGFDRIIKRYFEYHFKSSAPSLLVPGFTIRWFDLNNRCA